MPGLAALLLSPPRARDPQLVRRAVSGKTVLVTGASFGIGEATARLLSEAGAEVILAARSFERLRALEWDLRVRGGAAWAHRLDLADPHDVARFAAEVQGAHPRIDVVVSNAGRSIRRPVLRSPEKRDLERSLAVNFAGPAALLVALAPALLEHRGHIVSVSTVSAKPPFAPQWSSYQGSKAGFDAWLRAFALELRPAGVRVTSVYLPLVRTRMSAPTRLYRRAPALTPREAAEVIAGALVTPRARVGPWWLSAQELAAALVPGLLDRALLAVDRLDRLDGSDRE